MKTDARWAAMKGNKDPIYTKMKEYKNFSSSQSLFSLTRSVIFLKICLRSISVKFICGLNLLEVLHYGQHCWAGVNESRSGFFDFASNSRGDDVVICSWEHQGEPHSVFLLSFCDLLCCGKRGLRLGCISPCYMLWEEGEKEGFVS